MALVQDRRLVFLALALPFVLNDFFYIWADGSYVVYPANYALRSAVLIACLSWPLSRQMALETSLSRASLPMCLLAILALPAVCWVVFWYFVSPLAFVLGSTSRSRFPEISDPFLHNLDLTFGLLLVAISEELIFRKLCYGWLSKAGLSQARIVLWSAVFFSVTHWIGGFTPLLNTFIMGVLYMTAYIRLGRIWPLVLAHWVHNFIYFGLY